MKVRNKLLTILESNGIFVDDEKLEYDIDLRD